ncbi:MAG: response regulator [Planctomycetota bacterium]
MAETAVDQQSEVEQAGFAESSLPSVVYVIDDDADVRDSLCWLIESVGKRVEAFETADAFLSRTQVGAMAGCVVADLRLPGMSGLEMVEALTERGVALPVIMITGHGDVSAAVRAFKNGCIDFIEKPFSDKVLLERIDRAIQLDRQHRRQQGQVASIRDRMATLTTRETQVMSMVVVGKLNKQIAAELNLSHKTVEVHRSHVMSKMQAASLAELVRMAAAVGQ